MSAARDRLLSAGSHFYGISARTYSALRSKYAKNQNVDLDVQRIADDLKKEGCLRVRGAGDVAEMETRDMLARHGYSLK